MKENTEKSVKKKLVLENGGILSVEIKQKNIPAETKKDALFVFLDTLIERTKIEFKNL